MSVITQGCGDGSLVLQGYGVGAALISVGCVTVAGAERWTVTITAEGCGRKDLMGFDLYNLGAVVRLAAVFRDKALGGVLDPDAIKLTITDPSGNETTHVYGTGDVIERTDEGTYQAFVECDAVGMWEARWWSEGEGQAASTYLYKVKR
jgi:hypothetical protein